MDLEYSKKIGSFYMIDKASPKRFEGWPLDSLSISKETGKYFVDGSETDSKENIIHRDCIFIILYKMILGKGAYYGFKEMLFVRRFVPEKLC